MERARLWMVALGVVAVAIGLAAGPAWAGSNLPVPPFNVADFTDGGGDPFPIDNPYWPLVPGTTFLYESTDGSESNEFVVTHDTRVVAGVTCTVIRDTAWEEDLLVEYTEDWYAQDAFGNIWYFGEDSTSFEYDDDGNLIDVTNEGSWEAGVDDAEPGILMLANPQPGDTYRQEYYEDEAEDIAKVLRLNATVSIALGHFTDCLVTKESTPLAPGEVEKKYYAPGTGLVLVEELHGKTLRVELVEIIGPEDEEEAEF